MMVLTFLRPSYSVLMTLMVACFVCCAGACEGNSSLVAVSSQATPVPLKTPTITETARELESEIGIQENVGSSSDGQLSTKDDDALILEDIDEVQLPASPSNADSSPTSTSSGRTEDTIRDQPTEPIDSWLLRIVENPAARNIALRSFEISADLLVVNETADLSAYYQDEILLLAFDSNVRSFYGLFSFTALPPISKHQIESPLLFFEQVVVHETSKDASLFSEPFKEEVFQLLLGQGTLMLKAARPGLLPDESSPTVTTITLPGFSNDATLLSLEWPADASAGELSPRMYLAFIRQGNVTAAVALANSDESQFYRFAGVVERLVSRLG